MRYGSVCSGIEAATMAWHPLGWTPAFFSEIEAAPRAVLAHHYPEVPCHGDFTTIGADDYGAIDLLVGGTPCQSFSVAGLRGGIHDDRGNLALEFLRLVDRKRPRWVVWENVPGVFSSLSHDAPPDHGPPEIDLDASNGPQDGEEVVVEDSYDADESHALVCFLAGLSECGYGIAYRVLDAQFAGVPQRRRRVFVVGYLGDWRRAAAVLFERHSLSGNPPPRRETGEGVAPSLRAQSQSSHRADSEAFVPIGSTDVARTLMAKHTRHDPELESYAITHSLRGEGFDASEDGTGRGTPLVPVVVDTLTSNGDAHSGYRDEKGLVPVAFNITPSNSNKDFNARQSERAQALTAGGNRPSARGGDLIAFTVHGTGGTANVASETDTAGCLRTKPPGSIENSSTTVALQASAVRRLTPRECERLQGFPDDFTLVPYRGKQMADGPRYKMLGNSMAVPVMRFIGERIAAVETIQAMQVAA